ncbi:MAG: hypothetical protein WC819_02325 [Parcubacteria group bacterium]|jgi:hypothetical protein
MKTPISRRIFFWILFVSYFVTTASVLFFVFGYRHDFAQKIFVHTGSITVKANPKTISVYVDDRAPQSKLINVINDSYYISGIRPKTHTLKVSAEGFRTWEKSAIVHSGLSTEFWNITLLRNAYEPTSYAISDIDQFFPAPDENLFACSKQIGKVQTVHIFDAKKDETTNTFLFMQKKFTANTRENIEWSPNSHELIIPLEDIENSSNKDYAIAYSKTNDSFLLSEKISLGQLQSVRWDPKDRNALFFLAQNKLWRAQIDDENTVVPEIVADRVLAYDFTDDGLYVFTNEYAVLHDRDINGKNLEQITAFDILQGATSIRLDAYDTHRIAVLDDTNKTVYIYNKGERNIYNKKIGSDIIGANFSDDGKKLLFYSPFEIFVYFTRDWDAQPVRQEDDAHSIVRFSQFINNVHFAKDYEHVIFTINNDIKITELDYRGSRITDTIISLNEKETKVIDKQKMDRLYFIDSYDTVRRGLRSIEFPEKESLIF